MSERKHNKNRNREDEYDPRSLDEIMKQFGPQALNSKAYMKAILDLYKLEVLTKELDQLDFIDMQVDNMVEFPEAEYIWEKIRSNANY